MKFLESDFNPSMLPSLQALHARLKRGEAENFENEKENLISYIKKWTLNPGIRADLVNDVRQEARDTQGLISAIEEILLVFGGARALAAVAEEFKQLDSLLGVCEAGEEPPQWEPYRKLVKQLYELSRKMRDDLTKDRDFEEYKEDSYKIGGLVIQMLYELGYREAPRRLKAYVDKYHDKKDPRPAEEPEKGSEEEPKTAEPAEEPELGAEPGAEPERQFGEGTNMDFSKIDSILNNLKSEDSSEVEAKSLHDEMAAYAKQSVPEADEFDIEAAIYWLASDYHGGQASPLYAVLSMSEFRPGPTHSSVDDEGGLARDVYNALEDKFTKK